MNPSPRVLPECYSDTVLVEMLGFLKPNHQPSGIDQVIKVMETKLITQRVVGVIDNDKKIMTPYFREFLEIKQENGLVLKKHSQRPHYLILVSPALEKFILKSAVECDIPPEEFPFNERRLKEISKTQEAGKNPQFKNFVHRIIQRKSPGTETLKSWLQDLLGEEH